MIKKTKKNYMLRTFQFLRIPKSFGNEARTSARDIAGAFSEKGRSLWVQSSDQRAVQASGDIVFHPSMNLSSVAAWMEAGAGMLILDNCKVPTEVR